jgi:tetratricopeptide (TPR) repeat protein
MTEAVFRLFVSSPGDVAAERVRLEAVVEKLNTEFKDRARFHAVRWETNFYSAHETFQKQIPDAAECDLVVAIFRARLGSPLPVGFQPQADGEPYPSGTAYEVLSAIAKRRDGGLLPDIYVFRYPRDPQVSLNAADRAEIESQWRALEGFFERWFKTSGGQFVAGFQPYESTDDFAERIEECLRQWLANRGITARETWDRARLGSPFPGLAAFDADRERVFFGRDLAIRQATERLRGAKTPFLLILGASGTGKSSLLRAGLMPRIPRPGAIPEIDLFRPVLITPGLDPFAELAGALLVLEALGPELEGGRFADKDALTHALRSDPATAAALIGEALDKAAESRRKAAHFEKPRPARLLIGVDQAERLFTEASRDADAFAALLQALAGGVAYVIMVMRADAYARFQACAPLLALRARGATFDLTPPSVAELEEIVARPVAACEPPLAFGESDPPLVHRLVADAQGGDALPLMQMTLERLYKAQEARGDGILRTEDYKGMTAAVTETADEAMAHLGANGRGALDALVAGLIADVAPDPVTAEPLPVVVTLDRDAFVRGKPDRAALVGAFVEARLLTLEGGARLRPTHDALLRIWPEAATLVKEMAALIRARHALLPLAQAWVEAAPADKAEHLEVSAPLLAAGQQLEARFGEDLGTLLRPFIAEALSAEAAERTRKTRGRRIIFGATVAALAVMTLLAGAAAWQWRDAVAQRTAAVAAKNEADTEKAVAIEAKNDAITQKAQADQAKSEALAQKAATELNLKFATEAANSLVVDVSQKFRDSGVPASLVKTILDHALDLQQKLLGAGQSSPELLAGEGGALEETSLTLSTLGDTAGALEAARKEAAIFEALHERQPGNYDYQLDLTDADVLIGNEELNQGQLAQALDSYRSGLALAEPLFKSHPTDGNSQNDLTVLYQSIGDVEDDQGQFAQALDSYRKAHAIFYGLVESNPGNALFERNLEVSDEKIGDVEKEQDQYAEALDQYRAGLTIGERLAKADPGNTNWQKDLLLSYLKVGEVQGHLAQAAQDLDSYQAGLAQALDSDRAGLAIADRLAKSDPGNADWQRDLSVCDLYIGEVEAERGEFAQALKSYQTGLVVVDHFAKTYPGNVRWQRLLAEFHERVGNVELEQGQFAQALESYQDDRDIRQRLVESDPSNSRADWQFYLSQSYAKLGSAYAAQKDNAKAREAYETGRAIIARQVALLPEFVKGKGLLNWFDKHLAALEP